MDKVMYPEQNGQINVSTKHKGQSNVTTKQKLFVLFSRGKQGDCTDLGSRQEKKDICMWRGQQRRISVRLDKKKIGIIYL